MEEFGPEADRPSTPALSAKARVWPGRERAEILAVRLMGLYSRIDRDSSWCFSGRRAIAGQCLVVGADVLECAGVDAQFNVPVTNSEPLGHLLRANRERT